MDDDEITIDKKVLAYILIAILGGNAGVVLLNKGTPVARSDPFTGKEGRELERRTDRIDAEQQKMIWRMQTVERGIAKCQKITEEHLRQHK